MGKKKRFLEITVMVLAILAVAIAFSLIFKTTKEKKGSITIMAPSSNIEFQLCDKKIELTEQKEGEAISEGTFEESAGKCFLKGVYRGKEIYSKEVIIYPGELNYLFVESTERNFIEAIEDPDSFDENNPPPNVE